jgi:hypothetical protein
MSAKTLLKSLLKRSSRKAVVFSLFSLGSFTITFPSFAVSVNLSSGGSRGDVSVVGGQTTLTNATVGGGDDGGTNYNVSGNNPVVLPFQLETFLGVAPGALGTDAAEGSAIRTILPNVSAGDVLSFNSNFSIFDNFNTDRAFVTIVNSINNLVIPLTTGSSTFSYTFSSADTYTVGVGVIDVNEDIGSSRLQVSDANLQPVPEPLTILGSLSALGFGLGMRRRFRKQA